MDPLLIALLSLLPLLLFLLHRSKAQAPKEAPTIPGAWPILGHLPLLARSRSTHHLLGSLADAHGPLFTIKLGTQKTLVISNSQIAKECFTTNDVAVSNRPHLVACQNMTYNLAMLGFAPYSPFWRDMRRNVASAFLADHRIDSLAPVRVNEVRTSVKELYQKFTRISDGKNEYVMVDMKQWLKELALNVVGRMVAGKRYFGEKAVVEEGEAQRWLKALREYMRLMGAFAVGDAVPWLRWLDLGGLEKAMKENFKELDAVVGEWLEEHRRERDSRGDRDDGDFIDVMLSMIDGTTLHGFDADTVIKATAMAMILGGTDTSSATHIWTLSLLLNNPNTLKKVMEEMDTHIGKERLVTESDTNKLVYLHAVVKESLRLFPPTPLSAPREFREDCTLGGYHVKKGTRLMTNLWKIQTDPSVWEEPLEFKPERFLTTHKDVDVKGRHFDLIPFGSGRRICPGISFGLRTTYLTLANFLHSYEVVKSSNEPIDMTASVEITNVKVTPLEVLIKPRLSPSLYESM
ncbi:cytochrome P450 82A3 [Cajanus cajan]|uniref:Cytochrome P450 82A4 n=1 Tax=Cajanus cajan TaxID=3821 RepID=A0A151S388_CAJCA|nr:cytochrome P450 82A3 [Cajanus cajan]KYP49241.1 Cytochrome P450 82A4 [Cajanus cajan]